MKKLALITALVATSAVAVPAMADNGHHYQNNGMHQNASNHKYVKYNNGNAYGKYKNKYKPKKYAQNHYGEQRTHLKKWPVPTRPTNNMPRTHAMMGQHH